MKHSSLLMIVCLLLIPVLSACGVAAPGPQTWIDTPPDNTTLPLGPFNIMAHASDADGVATFKFYVNDQNIMSAETQGHNRLETMQIQWTPPGPGTYLIKAQGFDNNGNAGTLATSWVIISGSAAPAPTEQQIARETPSVVPIDTATTLPRATKTLVTPPTSTISSVTAKMNANCREGPGTTYEVYGNLLEGEEAPVKGRLADNSWLLIALEGRSSNCWVSASTVEVGGNLGNIEVVSAPSQPYQPPVDVLPPEQIDTTPPAIFGAATDKSSMCASDTVRSNVVAVDDGGISYVYASWTVTNNHGVVVESGTVNYVPISSQPGGYTGVFGPFSTSGTLTINGVVVDNAGNTVSFSHSVPITCS